MAKHIEFWTLLRLTQEYISQHYASALTDKNKLNQLKSYIDKYLRDNDYHVENLTTKELIDKLYCEMAEYSVLTPFLGSPDLEEINVNGWDDIALTYLDGSIVKLKDHFHSPQHAVDIIKRLLHHSGMIIDNASPTAQGHLPGNTRITALKDPIVDEDRGVSVSIRLLHPSRVTRENLVETGFATQEMVDFLCMCIRYGVPFVVAGATSSGKTTLLNAIMTSIPDNKRVFTIETGSRELSLVRRDENGAVINNIVHTLSRPSDNPAYDITQEDLVVSSLRFNPDVVCVGEMRDVECYSAVEYLPGDAHREQYRQGTPRRHFRRPRVLHLSASDSRRDRACHYDVFQRGERRGEQDQGEAYRYRVRTPETRQSYRKDAETQP